MNLQQIEQMLREQEANKVVIPDSEKWIGSKDGIVKILKYGEEIAREYQMYLDDDVDAIFGYDPEFEEGPPLKFRSWYKEWKQAWKEQAKWEASDEFLDELERLSEKD